MRLIACAAAALAAAIAAIGDAPARAQMPDDQARVLASRFGFTDAERATLAASVAAVRALPTRAPDGIAAMGAIRIHARPETYLRWAEDFADFDRGSSVQAVRKVSSPPAIGDFDGLALSADELRELARCRVGSCGMQLDAGSIRRVAAIDWRRASAGDAAAVVMREMLLDVARRYRQSGNAGLPHYHDSKQATDLAGNSVALIEEERRAGTAPAELLDLLGEAPNDARGPATSYLYWSTNTFGLKPTTRLNHTVVYRAKPDGVAGIIATKQLYASHYFHGALDVRYLVAGSTDASAFTLVMVTRTRSDGLTGVKGAVIGGTIRRRGLESLRAYLRFTKQAIEQRERAVGAAQGLSKKTPSGTDSRASTRLISN